MSVLYTGHFKAPSIGLTAPYETAASFHLTIQHPAQRFGRGVVMRKALLDYIKQHIQVKDYFHWCFRKR